jgi:hypothetical protein
MTTFTSAQADSAALRKERGGRVPVRRCELARPDGNWRREIRHGRAGQERAGKG